jgi:hypothetical protein
MRWNYEYRYKVLGKAASGGDGGTFLAFDLNSAIVFKPDADGKMSRAPEYPQEWGGGFGASADERHNNPLVRRFREDTLLMLPERLETERAEYDK